MNKANRDWKDKYLNSPKGYNHAMKMLELKLKRIGLDINSISEDEKIEKLNPFFGGSHNLIIGRRHYRDGAKFSHELCSSGELTSEEHFQYILLTVESLKDIFEQNNFIRYIIVFQNWLKPAGASFDHLHKQLVGLDEWGVQMEREMAELVRNPNLYNEFSINFGIYHSMLIAENDYAIAVSEFGHQFPTVAVYSKSEIVRPFDQTGEQIRGMSDLVHAIHSVISSQTTCNEEWYYSPFDSVYSMPWRICIKLRIYTPAGFEGNTQIYINPVHPQKLAGEISRMLEKKRDEGLICPDIRIGREVKREPNVLKYYKNKLKRL
jgi:galactose-1-phosphate uridylyltransferase